MIWSILSGAALLLTSFGGETGDASVALEGGVAVQTDPDLALSEIPWGSPRHDEVAHQAAMDYLASLGGSNPTAAVRLSYSGSQSETRHAISPGEFNSLIGHCSSPAATSAVYHAAGKTGLMVIWYKCDDGREGMSALFELNQGKLTRVDAFGWLAPLPAFPSMPKPVGN